MSEVRNITWLDNEQVSAVRITEPPRYYSATGYGRKIPTRYMLKIGTRWHRVYMMQFSNSGTAYVIKGGAELVLENETEYRIDRHREGATGPDVAINTLTMHDRFRFHHDGVVCTFLVAGESRYHWHDYQGDHYLYAGTYAGTGKTAWPYVYPTTDPETEATSHE